MIREIIFRAKQAHNGQWMEGYFSKDYAGVAYITTLDGVSTGVVDESTLGQYTGLSDKNGVKIFEGDVVFNSNKTLLTLPEDPRTYEIVWLEGQYDNENKWLSKKPSFSFRKIQPNNKRYMELIFNKSQIEVIGNIHDNPELIKQA